MAEERGGGLADHVRLARGGVLDAIYRHHPLFAEAEHERWSDDLDGSAELEGGDILVIGNGCVLIGMGERTQPSGVELLLTQHRSHAWTASSCRRCRTTSSPGRRLSSPPSRGSVHSPLKCSTYASDPG